MTSRIHLAVALVATAFLSACAPSSDMGYDQVSRSEASQVAGPDGQAAVQIKCEVASACQERAIAVCKNGPYKVLKSENMPTQGTMREVSKPGLVVIRCG